MIDVAAWIALVTYVVGAAVIGQSLFSEQGPNKRLISGIAVIALISHGFALGGWLENPQGINFDILNASILVSYLITLTICLGLARFHVLLLLPLCFGFSALLLLLKHFVEVTPLTLSFDSAHLWHIGLALLSYGIMIIATLFAGQMLYINNRLKAKDLTTVAHLPPLMQVEKQLFFLLAMGTALLLASLASGFMFVDNMFAKVRAHKTVFSLIALGVYLVLLWGHAKQGWRGKRVFTGMLVGTFLLSLAYFGSRFVREVLLSA